MCGVVGIFNLYTEQPVDAGDLCRMLHSIRHRGPDQFGIYTYHSAQSSIGLGNARLSIIDLQGGQQPIGNEDDSLWIVFNGEIFNYIELRPHLEKLGHAFKTDSDTEVILHLYEQYGTECVHHLNGQFAFAIWNEHKETLFMARDRLGVRPLYYTMPAGALVFASEVKALLALPHIQAEIDEVALDQIFTFWSPLPGRSAFKQIHTLQPGHWLKVGREQALQIEPYWRPAFTPVQRSDELTEEAYAAELRDLLIDATRIRLRADVPVGAYLSGGLDSSVITAIIQHFTDRSLETFSIGFMDHSGSTDEQYDERPFQLTMAKHLGTRHNALNCSYADIGALFPEVVRHTETPLLRTSPVPLYLLAQMVHQQGFKVVLTGEGADEFLGGYNIFKEDKIRRFWAKIPGSTLRPALLKKLYPYIAPLAQTNGLYLQQFFGKQLTDIHAPDYSHWIRWANSSRAKRFFSPDLRHKLEGNAQSTIASLRLPPAFSQWEPLARAQYLEITLFLSEYLLSSQGDRVAMAHSVEGRFPFLDYRVVDFCNRLPARLKLRGLNEKYLLKRAMRDLLPEEIWRRSKRPYRAPIQRSFFPNGKPLEWVAHALSPAQLVDCGYFEPAAIAQLLKKLERFGTLGETDEMALTGILSTQLLHQQFVATPYSSTTLDHHDDLKVVVRGPVVIA
jgi:asparagine synthase (glutamine-hydrolysing)